MLPLSSFASRGIARLSPCLLKAKPSSRFNLFSSVRSFSTPAGVNPLKEGDFDDPKVLKDVPNPALATFVLSVASSTLLTKASIAFLKTLKWWHLEQISWNIMSRTAFKYFAGGETLEDALNAVQPLAKSNVGAILDYSVEGDADPYLLDEVMKTLSETIVRSSESPNTPFTCFKMSSIVEPHLLIRLSELFHFHRTYPKESQFDMMDMLNVDDLNGFVDYYLSKKKETEEDWDCVFPGQSTPPRPLTVVEIAKYLRPAINRLVRLGDLAAQHNQRVLVDAEQTWMQDGIHFLGLILQARYNRSKPVFYTTYQLYLTKSPELLKQDMDWAKKQGVVLGAKIVRGAYLDSEIQRANFYGYKSPIFETIDQTHQAYNDAMQTLITAAKQQSAALVVASHNEQSIIQASQIMSQLALPFNHPYVHFAQLYGMSDHISYTLANCGHNVCKYVPFGPYEEVMPYLIRRLEENSQFLSNAKKHLRLLRQSRSL